MRILVTGNVRKLDPLAMAALEAAGHDVIGLDLRGSTENGVRTVACDREIARNAPLLSSARADDLIGYRPQYSWRNH